MQRSKRTNAAFIFTVRTRTMNARLCFLPFFDDYSIRPLEVDKRIRIFEALSNHIISGKI